MERYIWTHYCNDDSLETPWTALEINEGENPYELIAEKGEDSGAVFAATEVEAIIMLITGQKALDLNGVNNDDKR